jgi:hypothetical protein
MRHTVTVNRLPDDIQQVLVAEGLGEKLHCPHDDNRLGLHHEAPASPVGRASGAHGTRATMQKTRRRFIVLDMAGDFFQRGLRSRGQALQALQALTRVSGLMPGHNRHGRPERNSCRRHMIEGGYSGVAFPIDFLQKSGEDAKSRSQEGIP